MGLNFATPIFDGANWDDVEEWLEKAGLEKSGKTDLYDGMTGERFDQQVHGWHHLHAEAFSPC